MVAQQAVFNPELELCDVLHVPSSLHDFPLSTLFSFQELGTNIPH